LVEVLCLKDVIMAAIAKGVDIVNWD